MASKRPLTFEERKAALQAANAPRRPVTSEVPVEAPQPQKPAAPAKPVIQPRGRYTADILRESRPWTLQTNAPVYWAGMSESEWNNRATSLHRWVGTHLDASDYEVERAINHHFPRLLDGNYEDDIDRFVEQARYSRGEGLSTFQEVGGPHTNTSEAGIVSRLQRGGRNASLRNSLGDVTATDLIIEGGDWDAQNWTNTNGRMGIGIVKRVPRQNRASASQLLARAQSQNWTLGQFTSELQNTLGGVDDKLLEEYAPGNPKNKDGLIGQVYEPGKVNNVLGHPQKGSFDPSLGQGEYAIDFANLRSETLDRPIRESMGADGQGVRFYEQSGQVKLNMPFEETKAKAGSKGLVRKIYGDDMIESIGEAAYIRGERPNATYGTRYHAGLPIDGKQARAGAKELAGNWKGAAGLSLLNGASREVGVKLGQGDYAGAATEAAGNYVAGAAIERGIKSAATSGIGRRIGGAVARRIPAALARFGAGTAGSGGLLAPALAVATVVDVADGITEGVTGKGIVTHGREAGERAEARKDEARAAGASETDLRRAARRSQPMAPTKPVTEPVAVAPPAPTRSTGPSINPTGAKQIAGAWRRRRK